MKKLTLICALGLSMAASASFAACSNIMVMKSNGMMQPMESNCKIMMVGGNIMTVDTHGMMSSKANRMMMKSMMMKSMMMKDMMMPNNMMMSSNMMDVNNMVMDNNPISAAGRAVQAVVSKTGYITASAGNAIVNPFNYSMM